MFIYNGSNNRMKSLVVKANEATGRGFLRLKIIGHVFDDTTADSLHLSRVLDKYIETKNITVKTYYKRFSKAVAFFDPNYPDIININTAKMNRSDGSIIGTLYHEAAHAVDLHDTEHEYGHGNNSSVGKDNTFPYKVGSMVQEIIDGPVIYKPRRLSFWGRIRKWFTR